jgi:hypothetical protein
LSLQKKCAPIFQAAAARQIPDRFDHLLDVAALHRNVGTDFICHPEAGFITSERIAIAPCA